MFGSWLKGYFIRFSESRFMLDDVFRKRSASKSIPHLTEGEFFSCPDYENYNLNDVKDAYKERDFSHAFDELLKYYQEKKFPFFNFKNKEQTVKKLRSFPCSFKLLIEKADRICKHIINMPTSHNIEFGTFINWFSDFSDKSWMFLHNSDFIKKLQDKALMKQYNLNALSVSLDFNKHRHLTDLGRAFFLTEDEKYTQEFVIELEDWIQRNPVNWGVSWVDPMTVADRTISWCLSLSFFINSSYLRGEDFYRILSSLLLHGAYLSEALNDKSLRPSRRIAVSTALYLFAALFPEFEPTELWHSKAVRVLDSEAAALFTSDGVYRERSLGMQIMLTEMFILTLITDKILGRRSSPAVLSATERSLTFMAHTISPSGKPIMFGDIPMSRLWTFSPTSNEDFKNLLTLGTVIFNRGDFKFFAGTMHEDLIWFFNSDGEEMWERIQKVTPQQSCVAFPEGGYFNIRDDWSKDSTACFFIANPKKRSPSPEKGLDLLKPHRDLMSFALTIHGEPFIIETGAYKGPKPFWQYFSTTAAHNSIIIDGKEQSSVKNLKNAKKYMRLLKTRWLFNEDIDYIMSGNAGYEELRSMVVHRREILYLKKKKWFLIRDTLEGTDLFNVVNMFHFAPELETILRGDFACVIRGRRECIRLNPYYPSDFSCRLSRGKIDPVAGWYARDIGKLEPCQRIEYYAKLQLPAKIYTWISWARGEFRVPQKEELEQIFDEVTNSAGIKEEEIHLEVTQ